MLNVKSNLDSLLKELFHLRSNEDTLLQKILSPNEENIFKKILVLIMTSFIFLIKNKAYLSIK